MVRRSRIVALLATLTLLWSLTPASVLAAAPSLSTRTIQSGLVIPWDLAFTPAGQMIVTERPGRVRIYANGKPGGALLATTTIGSVRAVGEAGLMGIAVDHLFNSNRLIYVCVSRTYSGSWLNQVIRYKVNSGWKLVFDRYIIRTGMRANTTHNGCAVQEGPDHKIWVTMGDSADPMRAQNPNRLNGKVLRVNRDGTVPSDNPTWPGASAPTFVYSIGHRNPQGIAFQPGTGRVYIAEHGPDVDDELNWIRPGRNYGWPCVTGSNNPNNNNPACPPNSAFTLPVWSTEGVTIATSNAVFVRTSAWESWAGDLFVATLKESDLRRFSFDSGASPATLRQTLFNNQWGRLRAAVLGPGYQLYITTSNGSNDRVVRVTPN